MRNPIVLRRFIYFLISLLVAFLVTGFLLWHIFLASVDIAQSERSLSSLTFSQNSLDQKTSPILEGFSLSIDTDDFAVTAPIINGVTLVDLSQGLGKHRTTAFPSEEGGNVVISGHRWFPGSNPYHTIFRDLDKLDKGDRVSIFYDDKEYIYEIFEQKTVNADAVEILAQTEQPQLTLYTCTPIYTSQKRLVYVAKLIEVL